MDKSLFLSITYSLSLLISNHVKGSGSIKISPKQSIDRILVLSSEGKVIRSIENIIQEISIDNLDSGIYFVQIQTKDKSISQKVIVN